MTARRRTRAWMVAAGVAVALGVAAVLVLRAMMRTAPWVAERAICLSHLKQLGTAMSMYQEDNGGHLPAANAWCDQTRALGIGGAERFDCPGASGGKWGYGMNQALDRAKADAIDKPTETVCLFDIDREEANASGGPLNLVYRHHDRANMVYADGHAGKLTIGPGGNTAIWTAGAPRKGVRP